EISVYLETTQPIECDKPVIYFYPPVTTAVSVALNIKGKASFTYPPYHHSNGSDSAKDGWNFVADPDGTLHMNNKEYNYLFWDSHTVLDEKELNFDKGFIVESTKLVLFFEEKLSEMGFTSIEQADFITYWCPRMLENQRNFIYFIFNDACNAYADLEITPKPDNMLRVYMLWQDAGVKTVEPEAQILTALKRGGFTVLEWGGIEMDPSPEIK
ncbi:MAG TPA: hypothetical protein VD905_21630, partial [Flavobacteriales bacterium]|nr:hypothetical protein [Flavobacteriales bacterium]